MREFCELTWSEPLFPPPTVVAVFSNIDGNIVGHCDDENTLDYIFEVLESSSRRKDIPNEGSGMERILSRMFGVGGKYSSDNGFTEDDFNRSSKSMKFSKTFKA